MSPKLLLTLWRERWGKPSVAALQVPYFQGLITRWMARFAQASSWSLPGLSVLVTLLCGWLLFILFPVQFTLVTQIEFSVLLLIVALFLRSYEGALTSLVLMGLSLLVSARYFYWRLGATLGQDLDATFFFGFTLFAAEFYLFLQVVLGLVAHLWPIQRGPVPMPHEPEQWPSIDIFILCAKQPPELIESAVLAAMALDWPEEKSNTFLLDDAERHDIRAFANAMGVIYLSHPANIQGKVGNLNRALPESQAQFITLFECGQAPDAALLKSMVAWFGKEANLGLIQTPDHFLAPAPSGLGRTLFEGNRSDRSFAVIRRAMLLEVDGVQARPANVVRVNLAHQLQARGYDSAYLGTQAPTPQDQADQAAQTSSGLTPSDGAPFLVEMPVSNNVLAWKLRLLALQEMLRFYAPLPRLIFLLAPLPYLLGGIHIIQAPIGLLAAYALPHLLHGHIAEARTQGLLRHTGWFELRQAWFSTCLLVLTALSLVRTEIVEGLKRWRSGTVEKKPAFDGMSATLFGIVALLNLAGLTIGLTHLSQERSPESGMVILYLFWSLFNLFLLAARAAVAEEARQIQYHQRLQRCRPATLQMPLGRTLSCMTENFPEINLSLKLPVSMPMGVLIGSKLRLSLFRGDREFTFPAEVTSNQVRTLTLRILDTAQASYLQLSEATLTRGRDWPKWLPGREADRLIPRWPGKAMSVLRYGLRDIGRSFYKTMRRKN